MDLHLEKDESNQTENETKQSLYGCAGLDNMGNTCYMNSVIQCLSNCTVFRKYLMSPEFIRDSLAENKSTKDKEIVYSLQKNLSFQLRKLFSYFWSFDANDKKSWQPTSFRKLFTHKMEYFQNSAQHDSQEALLCILDTMHEELGHKMTLSNNEKDHIYQLFTYQDKKDQIEYSLIEKYPEKYFYYLYCKYFKTWHQKKYSHTRVYFGGTIISRLKCPLTNKSSLCLDPVFMFSLPIPTQDQVDNYQSDEETSENSTTESSDKSDDGHSDVETSEENQLPEAQVVDIINDIENNIADDLQSNDSNQRTLEDEIEDLSDVELETFEDNPEEWNYYSKPFQEKIKYVLKNKVRNNFMYCPDNVMWARIDKEKRCKIRELAILVDENLI